MKNNTITAPKGFLAAGIHCGVKQSGKNDLGIIFCPVGARAAAVFTTNKVTSAAVQISREHIKTAGTYAVVVNSGNANACTGKPGLANALKMCSWSAEQLKTQNHALSAVEGSKLKTVNIMVASTGVIGEPLPIDKVVAGISKAALQLSASPKAGMDFTHAIMTTDTREKLAIRKIKISGADVTIAGVVKGAGMIAPNMATTLCFITTDAAITKPLLAKALKSAIGNSLNKLTVDGHQSTNDTAIILASGLAGNRPIVSQDRNFDKFSQALADLCCDLVRQMALDAEGATRMFRVVVKGAATKADAARASRAIADYPLVKCAVHGSDPNWGRILCAAGSAGVMLNPDKISCKIGEITVLKNGRPVKFDAKKASKIISRPEHTITLDLGAGEKSDYCIGCDLSAEYVSINADYTT
jgi:glutamate N-acetyltransferase / amino-acid N-acetyltransferase